MKLPPLAFALGVSGLLPQIAVVAVLAAGGGPLRVATLLIGYGYAALILSFLGGLWWGLAARTDDPPAWLWIASVVPSLAALASVVPWAFLAAPGASLAVVGIVLIATLAVDGWLTRARIAPANWMRLRIPLSFGLGALTLVAAAL